MADPPALSSLAVATPQGRSGVLAHERDDYFFGYDADASRSAEISLLMPRRAEQYASRELHPIFQMNLPEGHVLERLRARVAKASVVDPMLLLALTGQAASIGRVHVAPPPAVQALLDAQAASRGERLHEILAWDGAESLFEQLAQRYLLRTGVSGVQPKLLVPERMESPAVAKAMLATSDLIVKSGGSDYPGLAVNEFVCMSIARRAGIPTPEFFLSANRELFVMRRFDHRPDGGARGFEDLCVLMGKGAARKYEGSYEQVARFVALFCAPQHVLLALAQLFDQVALSCILGNGDAHLKNFGVLYDDPTQDDVALAPAYDIVNTTSYIPDDSLALTLGGSKSLFASRVHLIDFAPHCRVRHPRERILALLDAAHAELELQHDLLDTEPVVATGLRAAVQGFASRFKHIA